MKKYIVFTFLSIVWFTCVGQTVETIQFTKGLQKKTIIVEPIDFGFFYYNGYLDELSEFYLNPEWDVKCSDSFQKYLLAAYAIEFSDKLEHGGFRTMTEISYHFDLDWDNPNDKKFYHSILWLLHPEYSIQELQRI